MARLLADENFPYPVTEELRRLGHDVSTMADLGKANQSVPDDEVLSIGIAERRTVLSYNRKHFIRLHKSLPSHCGIVVCTFDLDFISQASRISDAIGKAAKSQDSSLELIGPVHDSTWHQFTQNFPIVVQFVGYRSGNQSTLFAGFFRTGATIVAGGEIQNKEPGPYHIGNVAFSDHPNLDAEKAHKTLMVLKTG